MVAKELTHFDKWYCEAMCFNFCEDCSSSIFVSASGFQTKSSSKFSSLCFDSPIEKNLNSKQQKAWSSLQFILHHALHFSSMHDVLPTQRRSITPIPRPSSKPLAPIHSSKQGKSSSKDTFQLVVMSIFVISHGQATCNLLSVENVDFNSDFHCVCVRRGACKMRVFEYQRKADLAVGGGQSLPLSVGLSDGPPFLLPVSSFLPSPSCLCSRRAGWGRRKGPRAPSPSGSRWGLDWCSAGWPKDY